MKLEGTGWPALEGRPTGRLVDGGFYSIVNPNAERSTRRWAQMLLMTLGGIRYPSVYGTAYLIVFPSTVRSKVP